MASQCLYRAENSIEAHLLSGFLAHQGVEAELRGEALSGAIGELPADMLQVELWVETQRLAKAQQLLAQWQLQKSATEQWQCPQCHEINPANFDLCWQCGQPAPRSE